MNTSTFYILHFSSLLFIIKYAKPSLNNYISVSNGKKMAMGQKNKNEL